jgi:DNA modification methylase
MGLAFTLRAGNLAAGNLTAVKPQGPFHTNREVDIAGLRPARSVMVTERAGPQWIQYVKLRPRKPLSLWPAQKIEFWPTGSLKPSPTNSRRHTKADELAVAASMERFGVTIPLLVDEQRNLISGHCRLGAAKHLKLPQLPVIVARGWTESEKRAYCIADNQLAARANWDIECLKSELKYLEAAGFELPLIGFEDAALMALIGPLGNLGLGDPDKEFEPPEEPITRLGDVLLMGDHRVGCGDSTDAAAVRSVLDQAKGGPKPALMVTDPPYGVDYDPSWRGRADGKKSGRATGKVLNDDRSDWREAWEHFPGDVAYVWHAGLRAGVVADSLKACGFELRSQIVWAKPHFTLSRGDYHWQHECCLYAVRKGARRHWRSDRKQSTLWEVGNNGAVGNLDREKTWGHGTQKPVEIMRRPIEHNSSPGDVVYDPFLGTGTTLIAAEMTGRACVGLELNPAYVDVIVKRWSEFTGRDAIHAKSQKSFSAIAAARARSLEDDDVAQSP